MNVNRIKAIIRKEFIQILRDYRSLGLAVFIPVILMVLFGFALSLDVNNVPIMIWNQDKSQTSSDFLLNFTNSRYFHVVGYTDNYPALERAIDARRAMMALVIPSDFGMKLHSGQTAPVQLLVDGSDSNTATIAMGYVNGIVERTNASLLSRAFAGAGAPDTTLIDLRPRIWFNENLESKNFVIPGLIAVIMMIIAAQLTSLTVAREWERGTMEQLISTPVRSGELVVGKLIPYFLIGLFDVLVAIAMGQFVFHVPLRGDFILLLVLSCIFLVGALSQGIYFSIVAKNQRLATQMALLTTFLPTFLLSGFVYPIYNMPKLVQAVTYVVPARYFISILKGIYLKGEGLDMLWPQALLLVVFSASIFGLAYRRLVKKVV